MMFSRCHNCRREMTEPAIAQSLLIDIDLCASVVRRICPVQVFFGNSCPSRASARIFAAGQHEGLWIRTRATSTFRSASSQAQLITGLCRPAEPAIPSHFSEVILRCDTRGTYRAGPGDET
jgi:hypothetical protein